MRTVRQAEQPNIGDDRSGTAGFRLGARSPAVLLSLALHALILGGFLAGLGGSQRQVHHDDQPALKVIMLPAPLPLLEPSAKQAAQHYDPIMPVRSHDRARPAPKPQAALNMPSAPAPSPKEPAVPAQMPSSVRASPPLDPARTRPDMEAADAAWSAYQQTLWRRIVARRPDGIRMMGEALVRFTVNESGAMMSATLERSSGNKMLDRLALRSVRSASPFPPPPEAAKERGLTFSIRYSFGS